MAQGTPLVALWKEGIYIYVKLIHFAIQEKLTQHYKGTVLQ